MAAELGRILIYEAARDWLPTVAGQVQTPLGIADAEFVDPMQPVKVCHPAGCAPKQSCYVTMARAPPGSFYAGAHLHLHWQGRLLHDHVCSRG